MLLRLRQWQANPGYQGMRWRGGQPIGQQCLLIRAVFVQPVKSGVEYQQGRQQVAGKADIAREGGDMPNAGCANPEQRRFKHRQLCTQIRITRQLR